VGGKRFRLGPIRRIVSVALLPVGAADSFLPETVARSGRLAPQNKWTRGASMLEEIQAKLENEIMNLTHELSVDLPVRIKIAREHGDLRENAEFKAAKERQAFVEARLNHLSQRMTELSKIDVHDMVYDRVGFGSKVKIRDLGMEEDFEFTITAGDFIDLDGGQVSLASPIGRGLLGAAEGEEVSIALPAGERRYKILQLTTLPQQLEAKKG
jgi:transcription elongation factor GreA